MGSVASYWPGGDIVGLVGLAAVAPMVTVLPVGSWVRLLIVLPVIAFIPGYMLMLLCFPRAPTSGDFTEGGGRLSHWPGTLERLAGSVALSIPFVAVYALVVWAVLPSWTPFSFALFSGTTAVIGVLAAVRRALVPEYDRYRPAVRPTVRAHYLTLRGQPAFTQLVTVFFILSVVAAVGVLAFGLAAPQAGEEYTQFLVGTENDSGDLVLSGYPDSAAAGDDLDYLVGIENHYRTTIEYSLTIELQRIDNGTIFERETFSEESIVVEPGASMRVPQTVTPSMTGEGLRMMFILEPTANDATATAVDEQTAHLWIDITEE